MSRHRDGDRLDAAPEVDDVAVLQFPVDASGRVLRRTPDDLGVVAVRGHDDVTPAGEAAS